MPEMPWHASNPCLHPLRDVALVSGVKRNRRVLERLAAVAPGTLRLPARAVKLRRAADHRATLRAMTRAGLIERVPQVVGTLVTRTAVYRITRKGKEILEWVNSPHFRKVPR